MKVVVFGGSGFVGSHVADALTEAGHEVTIFDKRTAPYLTQNQKMIVGDILDQRAVEKAVRNCEVVYNFAAIADMDEARKDPLDTVRINILGNTILLEAARKNNIKRFIFASSVYVYSEAGSFYRSSKQACELIIENYQKDFGLDFTVLRYGSLYGDRSDERNGVFRILKRAITEGKIVYHGDGEDIREYIHVKDAARCSVEILDDCFKNEYVILTGPQPMRVKDLHTMVREIIGKHVKIEYRKIDDGTCPYNPETHYKITPYSYRPRIGKKLISRHYLDLGQGILSLIQELDTKFHRSNNNLQTK